MISSCCARSSSSTRWRSKTPPATTSGPSWKRTKAITSWSSTPSSYDERAAPLSSQPIGLFIGANYLVSVHQGEISTIDETIKRWQANAAEFGHDAGALLYALLDAIVDDYFPVIDQLAERVEDIEEQIFERFSEDALQEVFGLKRDLLQVRRIVAPERDVLNVLIRREVPIFERNTILYLQDVYDHIVRITDSIDTYRDLLSSALDAFLSVQSNRLNQIVKVLTIASIMLMTNALIAGIYGMNFDFMPELHWTYGYPFALGLMVVISTGSYCSFGGRSGFKGGLRGRIGHRRYRAAGASLAAVASVVSGTAVAAGAAVGETSDTIGVAVALGRASGDVAVEIARGRAIVVGRLGCVPIGVAVGGLVRVGGAVVAIVGIVLVVGAGPLIAAGASELASTPVLASTTCRSAGVSTSFASTPAISLEGGTAGSSSP